MEAGKAARQAYSIDTPPYMPHLSLLYADVEEEGRKTAAKASISRLMGEGADYGTLLPDNTFSVDSLALWYTPVEDHSLDSWREVACFNLAG